MSDRNDMIYPAETHDANSEALIALANLADARGNHELAASLVQAAGLFAVASAAENITSAIEALTQTIDENTAPGEPS